MGRLTFESVQDERTRNRRPASKAFPAEPSLRSERPHGSRRARARAPHDGNAHGQRGKKFQIRENLFPETGTRNSRSSAQQRCSPANGSTSLLPSSPAEVRRSLNPSGDQSCPSA